MLSSMQLNAQKRTSEMSSFEKQQIHHFPTLSTTQITQDKKLPQFAFVRLIKQDHRYCQHLFNRLSDSEVSPRLQNHLRGRLLLLGQNSILLATRAFGNKLILYLVLVNDFAAKNVYNSRAQRRQYNPTEILICSDTLELQVLANR